MPEASDAVWLPVLPSMSGFGPALIKGAGAEADKAGQPVGKRYGKAILGGVAIVAGAGVAAAGALYKIGETFDDVTDTIRVGTGATGAALDGLVDSAKNVGRNVPAEFEAVGTVVADINTRMGLSGETLELVASQYLEAGRILGEEVDIGKTSAAFNAFGIEGEAVSGAMDHLFRVSQATGVGMNELATNAQASAPAMRALGFSFEETTALVGNLDKAGLNSGKMMAGMSRALVELAKDGEAPQDAFKRVTGEIQGFIEKGDTASAVDMASKLFGTRNATQFIGALESGALAMDDLGAVAGMTEDTILGAGAETMDFAEQWQMFKNNILADLEPLASRVFGAIGNGMTWLKDIGVPALKSFADQASDRLEPALTRVGNFVTGTLVPGFQSLVGWLQKNQAWLVPIAAGVGAIVAAWLLYQTAMSVARGVTVAFTAAQAALNVVMNLNPIGIVILALVGLAAAFAVAWNRSETFRNVVMGAWNGIKSAASAVWTWLKGAFDAMKAALGSVATWFKARFADVGLYWAALKMGLKLGWDWIKANVFDRFTAGIEAVRSWFSTKVDQVKAVWDGLKAAFKAVWDWIDSNVFAKFKAGLDKVEGWVRTAKDNIGTAWKAVANLFRNPINWVLNTVWNGGIKKAFDNAAKAIGSDKRLASAPTIPAFARGGRYAGGLALVGEEGPELINFARPGFVHTAAETSAMLGAGEGSENARGGLRGVIDKVVGWARGGLAAAAGLLLDPIKRLISGTVGKWGTFGGMAGDTATNAIDSLVSWIKGKDSEVDPVTGGPLAMSGGWTRPSRGPVTQRFGVPGVLSGLRHAGIDIAGGGPTFAAAAGKVLRTGWNILGGRTGIGILLQHARDLFTYYGHNPVGGVRVQSGQDVKAGQRIGAQGSTGNVTGTHLHFELHRGGIGRAVNPTQMGVFDQGGYLAPGALGANLSRRPEPVLTGQQWADISTLANRGATSLDGARITGGLRILDDGLAELVDGRIETAAAGLQRHHRAETGRR